MTIIVINGYPGSGKDQFVKECQQIRSNVYNLSTVDFVKKLAIECGWNGEKSPKNRKFLSDLKKLITDWGDVPYKAVMEEIGAIFYTDKMTVHDGPAPIFFVHCREPKEIEKFIQRAGAYSLYIDRPSAHTEQSNSSDAEVTNFTYDFYIDNSRDLNYLHERAEEFLQQFN